MWNEIWKFILYIRYMGAKGNIDTNQTDFDTRIYYYQKTVSPNCNNLSNRLIDIFGKKSAIRTGVHIPGIFGLEQ